MKRVKILVFKESGKYYTEEDLEIPEYLTEMYQVVEYVEYHFQSYKGMHLVMLLDEFEKGYPCMIPAERRQYISGDKGAKLAAAVGDYRIAIREVTKGFAVTIFEKAAHQPDVDGVYMCSDISIGEVLEKVVNKLKYPSDESKIVIEEDVSVKLIDYDRLMNEKTLLCEPHTLCCDTEN